MATGWAVQSGAEFNRAASTGVAVRVHARPTRHGRGQDLGGVLVLAPQVEKGCAARSDLEPDPHAPPLPRDGEGQSYPDPKGRRRNAALRCEVKSRPTGSRADSTTTPRFRGAGCQTFLRGRRAQFRVCIFPASAKAVSRGEPVPSSRPGYAGSGREPCVRRRPPHRRGASLRSWCRKWPVSCVPPPDRVGFATFTAASCARCNPYFPGG
jgi:hypothetical protein